MKALTEQLRKKHIRVLQLEWELLVLKSAKRKPKMPSEFDGYLGVNWRGL